ncbi:MAG TPA: YqgE/AlgH family protein [Rhodanobacteraceae bacterium]
MDPFNSLAGQFLIAMPGMGDPDFSRGVTLVCQHNEEGAIGLLVNRLAAFTMGDVLEQMQLPCERDDIRELPVLHGGPVQTERGFVLHDGARSWDASFRIDAQWAVTTSRDILVATAAGEGPEHFMMALGYAGWGAGQLDEEIKANAWLTAQADSRIVFQTPIEQRWSAAAGLAGVDIARLAGYAGHA